MLDLGELHELGGELVGVERVERILVLQLRREQRQEGLEVAGEGVAITPELFEDEEGLLFVSETTLEVTPG